MQDKQVFLIQTSGATAEHETVTFEDRTYADELSQHHYYRNEHWDQGTGDVDFGKAQPGDYVLQYSTGNVETSPRRIAKAYEIVGLDKIEDDIDSALEAGQIDEEKAETLRQQPHILRLKLYKPLNTGLERPLIKRWVAEGKLSERMGNCGRQGFNICLVQMNDFHTIMEWDKLQPSPPLIVDHLEEDLRHYIADRESLAFVGRTYRDYKLYSDESGPIGEEYDTKAVGEIDLLFENQRNGDFLVVELKRTEDTSDRTVGQIARYMGWTGENVAKGKKVRGLLIVRSASEELRYAVKALKDCQLATYELAFNINLAK